MGYLEICCNLYKSITHQSLFSMITKQFSNSLNMMDSDMHYEGNHLYIWQLCMLLWHPWSSQNSVILQLCDLGFPGPRKICKGALVCEHHDMGYREIDCNLYKSMSYQSFFPFFKTFLKIALVWWLVTSILKVTVCIFDSFVCDLGILDHRKILLLQHCDLGILDPCKILCFCKDGLCLWTLWYGVGMNILQCLQKHFP